MPDQLTPGSLLVHNNQLYIVEAFDGSSVDVGLLGSREVEPKHMFDVGDRCPLPDCDGEVDSVGPGERRCTNGCLSWEVNHCVDGEPCPSCEDGTVTEERSDPGRYTVKCTNKETCGRYAFGAESWYESWWPSEKYSAIAELTNQNPIEALRNNTESEPRKETDD